MAHSDHPFGGVHAPRHNYRRESLFAGYNTNGATYRALHQAPAEDVVFAQMDEHAATHPALRPGKTARKRALAAYRAYLEASEYAAAGTDYAEEALAAWAEFHRLSQTSDAARLIAAFA